MKKILIAAVAGVAIAVFQLPANADAKRGMEEAKEHGCLKCHDVEKKKVGPSYKDISAKLKGKTVEDGMAAVKAKSVHKKTLEKASDGSLKDIMTWVMSL
jgi:cytochrome c